MKMEKAMKKALEEIDKSEGKNVLKLKVVSGDEDENWLWGLPEGSVFLCYHAKQPLLLTQFMVIYKSRNKAVMLRENLNGTSHDQYFNSEVFSKTFKRYEVQRYGTDEPGN